MSWHMSPRYGNVILVSAYPIWLLSIDHIVNGQYKRYGFVKTHLSHPSLPFDSLPYPTRTICRRVRTYARSVTSQPNEKRLTIFYEYGALSHARFAREGAPLWCWTFLIMDGNLDSISFSTNWQRVCYLWKLNDFKVTMPFLRYDQKQGTRES